MAAPTERPTATISDDGEVHWQLVDGEGEQLVLENGVTYTIAFTVWPKQEAVDLVADLNNGVIKYEDLSQDERAQIYASGGTYSLKTNTDYPQVQYSTVTTTTVDGGTTSVTSDPTWANITNPDPVGLAESKLNAVKSWDDSLDEGQREEIDDVKLYLMMDGDYYYVGDGGSPLGVTLTEDSNWTETDYLSIAPGLMVPEGSPAYDSGKTQVIWDGVVYAILEAGHEYVFEEENINNYFELTAYTHHPMIMGTNDDGTPHIVDIIFTKDDNGDIIGIESVEEMGDNISATNTLKPGINVLKTVVDADGTEITDTTDVFEVTVYVVNGDGGELPVKTASDGTTTYTIDYRIYYGPNNPKYENPDPGTDPGDAAKHRSGHIYANGTSFTEGLYVGDVIRVVNVEADAVYRVEETEAFGYTLESVDYQISHGSTDNFEPYVSDGRVIINDETYYPLEGNAAAQAELTNTYAFGDAMVIKDVEVSSGNAGQAKGKEFEFTFKLYTDSTKQTELVGRSYKYTIYTQPESKVSEGTISSGGTFQLKDDQYIYIESLPEGAYYEVEEGAVQGYATTVESDDGDSEEALIGGATIVKDDCGGGFPLPTPTALRLLLWVCW